MALVKWLLLAVAVACVAAEEISPANFGELHSGCWILRFYAPWCAACSSTEAEWTAAQQEESLRFGCRFGNVNVDRNMALSEAFGIHSIPSFFVLHSTEGVCRFDAHSGPFTVASLVQFHKECKERGPWESGVWSYPLSWIWSPLIRAGYVAEYAHRFMKERGLSHTQEMGVAGALLFAVLLVWGFAVFVALRCCCGAVVSAVERVGRPIDESDEEEEEQDAKLKKD